MTLSLFVIKWIKYTWHCTTVNEHEYLCSSSTAPCYASLPLLLQWKIKQQIKQNQQQIIMENYYKSTGSL